MLAQGWCLEPAGPFRHQIVRQSAPPMRFTRGDRLGPYEICDLLGAGGMGEVYRALDQRLGREVAIKVLHATDERDERRRQLEREARTVASLDHPNLLTVFDIGVEGSVDYLVTELLQGETLRARLERGAPLGWREAARIGEALARGLAAAHRRGIVHRDVKPENVFLTSDGRIKILDFGLAHVDARTDPIGDAPTVERPAPEMIRGTVRYMAPEQALGEVVDERTDLFALGVVLYECLSGESPFRRDSIAATLAAVIAETPPSLAARSGVSGALADLVDRCLAKARGARPASAESVAAALARVQTESPVETIPPVSIAVLPFADLSAARDQGFLCDGLAEEILHALTRLAGLRVAARSSSFQFRGGAHDLRAIGQRLDVDHVLDGSVRRAGDRLRINLQLVEVATGAHLWAERYDVDAGDVFAVEDEIAGAVATTLSVVITDEARRAWRRRRTRDLPAYEAYLRALQIAAREHPETYRRAQAELERAVDLDPTFVAAWAALAEISANLFEWYGHAARDLARAEAASARALELDPDGAEAHSARGRALAIAGRHDEAAHELDLALLAEPRLFEALYRYARMRFSERRTAEAADLFERAARVRGEDYQSLALAAQAYEGKGDAAAASDCTRRALARVERRLRIAPDDPRALYFGAHLLFRTGDRERAIDWARRAGRLDPDNPATLYNVCCLMAKIGSHDEALDLLERAVTLGFGLRAWIEHDTDLEALRSSPRFAAVLARLA